ncbi:MAG: DNA-protecting protein DprA [Desulforudis sp.]|nr:MAG: DNA-protecting protein DprA [Desulforudis sp.]
MSLEHLFWLAWASVLPAGGQQIIDIVEHFGSAHKAWSNGERALAFLCEKAPLRGQARRSLPELTTRFKATDPVREEALLKQAGAGYLTWTDDRYPEPLRHIFNPPAVLYYLGEIKPEDKLAVALVGSRRATYYGRDVAQKLGRDLAAAGLTVVSGMARGIDTAAHRGALEAGGRTVAVLGSGLDVVYPRENIKLMREIAGSGAVVTEFPLGAAPEAWHFPVRNRIISGISRGVVVVEAAERSGALITAELALEQGKDVMAVPGNISSPVSRGPNRLIKQGARLVDDAEDILDEIGLTRLFDAQDGGSGPGIKLDPDEERVLQLISVEPLAVDLIIRDSGLPAERVASVLAFLEVKGLARRLPAGLYLKS